MREKTRIPLVKDHLNSVWRFKTEEEFIREYGPAWRGVVPNSFPVGMDMLLGRMIKIPASHIRSDGKLKGTFVLYGARWNRFQVIGLESKKDNLWSWTISPEMLLPQTRKKKVKKLINIVKRTV